MTLKITETAEMTIGADRGLAILAAMLPDEAEKVLAIVARHGLRAVNVTSKRR
jgi:hypothetical protein